MSMNRNRRRHNTGFGYIGFGNRQEVFNQHSKKPFSILKDKLNEETHLHHQLHFLHKDLTKKEKEGIKNKIRKAERTRTIKIIITTFILIIVLSIVSYKYLLIPLFNAFQG